MVVTNNKKSINNLHKSTSSIGIPSIFFKNKSILNFSQLTSLPKTTTTQRPDSIWAKLKPSIYGEKLSNRVKRAIIPDQSYLDEQRIQVCKILESKKRKFTESQEDNHKVRKICINSPESGHNSDTDSKNMLFQSPVNLCSAVFSKSPSKRSNVLNPANYRFSRTIDKEYTLRDESFLSNPYLFEQIQNPKSTNISTGENLCSKLPDINSKMTQQPVSIKNVNDKIIDLKVITSEKQPINQYKTKSISQLLSEIDNHRLMSSKNNKISSKNFNQRFENIKNLLNDVVPANGNKESVNEKAVITNFGMSNLQSNNNSNVIFDGATNICPTSTSFKFGTTPIKCTEEKLEYSVKQTDIPVSVQSTFDINSKQSCTPFAFGSSPKSDKEAEKKPVFEPAITTENSLMAQKTGGLPIITNCLPSPAVTTVASGFSSNSTNPIQDKSSLDLSLKNSSTAFGPKTETSSTLSNHLNSSQNEIKVSNNNVVFNLSNSNPQLIHQPTLPQYPAKTNFAPNFLNSSSKSLVVDQNISNVVISSNSMLSQSVVGTQNSALGVFATASSNKSGQSTNTNGIGFGKSTTSSNNAFGQTVVTTKAIFGQAVTTDTVKFGQSVSTTSNIFGKSIETPSSTIGQSIITSGSIFGKSNSAASNTFGQPVSTASNTFGQPVSTASNTFGQPVSTASYTFGQPVSTASNSLGQPVNTATNTFGRSVSTASNTFGQLVSTASNSLGQPVSTATNTFGRSVSTAGNTFGQLVSTAGITFGQPVSTAGITFGQLVSTSNNVLGQPTGATSGVFGQSVTIASNVFGSQVSSISNASGLPVMTTNSNFGQSVITTGHTFGQSISKPSNAFGPSLITPNNAQSVTSSKFGQSVTAANSTFGQSGSTFGQLPPSNLFGQSTNSSNNVYGQPETKSISKFGQSVNTSSNTFIQASNAFSPSIAVSNNTSNSLFGQSNDTVGNTFQQSFPASNSLFGQTSGNNSTTFGLAVATSNNIFGKSGSSNIFVQSVTAPNNTFSHSVTSSSMAFSQVVNPSNTVIGQTMSTQNSLFGQSNNISGGVQAQSQNSGSNLFGQSNAHVVPNSIFGQNSTAVASPFGQAGAISNKTNEIIPASQTVIFGKSNTESGLFGNGARFNSSNSSVFGQSSQTSNNFCFEKSIDNNLAQTASIPTASGSFTFNQIEMKKSTVSNIFQPTAATPFSFGKSENNSISEKPAMFGQPVGNNSLIPAVQPFRQPTADGQSQFGNVSFGQTENKSTNIFGTTQSNTNPMLFGQSNEGIINNTNAGNRSMFGQNTPQNAFGQSSENSITPNSQNQNSFNTFSSFGNINFTNQSNVAQGAETTMAANGGFNFGQNSQPNAFMKRTPRRRK